MFETKLDLCYIHVDLSTHIIQNVATVFKPRGIPNFIQGNTLFQFGHIASQLASRLFSPPSVYVGLHNESQL